MAWTKFKPTLWSKQIMTDLHKSLVLADYCDYTYEGEIKMGGILKIVGSETPTIKKYVPNTDIELEIPNGTDQDLLIDQFDYFNVAIDDIDKAQSLPGGFDTYTKEGSYALASSADAYVGSLAKNATHKSASTSITKTNGVTLIDEGLAQLYENNVSNNTELAFECSPKYYISIKQNLQELSTSNVDLIRKGAVGMYGNALVKISNNLYKDATDVYNMLRTKKAIAFANQINKVEPYRIEKRFSDAVKALHVYGAKLVRPAELYVVLQKVA